MPGAAPMAAATVRFLTNSAVQIWRRTGAGDGTETLAVFYAAGAAYACIVAYRCWRSVERPPAVLVRRRLSARYGKRWARHDFLNKPLRRN